MGRLSTRSRRALRYWRSAGIVLLLGVAVSYVVARTMKLAYRSECTLVVRSAPHSGAEPDERGTGKGELPGGNLKDGLLSRVRLEDVIAEFTLYPRIVETRGMVAAIEELRLHVGLRAHDRMTYVLSFEDEDPTVAREVTQRLADSMIREYAIAARSRGEDAAGDRMTLVATPSEPASPANGRAKTAIVGGALALLLAVGYALVRAAFSDVLVGPADVERMRLLPVLGVVPRLPRPRPGAAAERREAPRAL
jgi:hypothetical protein